MLKHLQISEQTCHRWRKRYGELSPDDAKRLRELKGENRRLKKLGADQALDIDMLKEIVTLQGAGRECLTGSKSGSKPTSSRTVQANLQVDGWAPGDLNPEPAD